MSDDRYGWGEDVRGRPGYGDSYKFYERDGFTLWRVVSVLAGDGSELTAFAGPTDVLGRDGWMRTHPLDFTRTGVVRTDEAGARRLMDVGGQGDIGLDAPAVGDTRST